jgi:hypothetical protein
VRTNAGDRGVAALAARACDECLDKREQHSIRQTSAYLGTALCRALATTTTMVTTMTTTTTMMMDERVVSQGTDEESVRTHDEDSRSSGSLFHAPFGARARLRRVFQSSS